jgi:hypothetical protein
MSRQIWNEICVTHAIHGKIKDWEAEDLFMHRWVAHLLFWSSYHHQMSHLAFRAKVMPIMVDGHLCFCATSMSVDCLQCHFGTDGSRLCDFREPSLGVFRLRPSLCYTWDTQHPASSLFGLPREVS